MAKDLYKAAREYGRLLRALASKRPTVVPLRRGVVLGEFEIDGLIGRGGTGEVYRAHLRSGGGREVALKVARGVSPETASQWRRAVSSAQVLRHPNLAAVYGLGEQGNWIYYAMRLVSGPSLQEILERLNRNPKKATEDEITRRRIVRIISGVASALACIHKAGLVHRDVRPGNILLEAVTPSEELVPDHPAVLVDLGFVQAEASESATGEGAAASLSYSSPELHLGKQVDARADVFSLAVTLHDLLSCRLPSQRDPAAAGMEPLDELFPGFDSDLAAIVARGSDPLPSRRYRDAGGFHSDLEAWQRGGAIVARRARWSRQLAQWYRRHLGILLKTDRKTDKDSRAPTRHVGIGPRYVLRQDKLLLLYALDRLDDHDLQKLVDTPYRTIEIASQRRERARKYLTDVEQLSPRKLELLNREVPHVEVRLSKDERFSYEVAFWDRPDGVEIDPWAFVFIEYVTDVCGYEKCGRLFVPSKRTYPRGCSTAHYQLLREGFPERMDMQRERQRELRERSRRQPRGK